MAADKWTENDVKEMLAPVVYTADWAADCPPFEMAAVGMSLSLIRYAKRPFDDPVMLRMQSWRERVLNDVNIIKQVMRGEADIEFADGATEPTVRRIDERRN